MQAAEIEETEYGLNSSKLFPLLGSTDDEYSWPPIADFLSNLRLNIGSQDRVFRPTSERSVKVSIGALATECHLQESEETCLYLPRK